MNKTNQELYYERTPVLETERLILRPLTPDDAETAFIWHSDPRVNKFMSYPLYTDISQTVRWITEIVPVEEDIHWGIVLKESNKVVGMIAVFDIQNARMGDIGYRIHPEYWNMGITTEALKEVVRFIFENTEIERLNGRADVRNVASNKVMEKCGFIKEGTIRQGKMVSVYCDYNIYGMLREDYAKIN